MRRIKRKGGVMTALLVGLLAPSCGMSATQPAPVDAAVKPGQWGGQHIAMAVAASRTDIEFDCGKATVDGAIETDRDGGFSVAGTFLPEGPGPTSPEAPPKRPMRLTGTVKGDDMQVKVVLTDQNEDIGSFALSFGASPRLIKCR